MAISQKNYIDVNSRFPEKSSVERNLGGLVFTKSDPKPDAWKKPSEGRELSAEDTARNNLIKEFNDGNLIALNLKDVFDIFGGPTEVLPGSDEYEFAVRYYSYSSPTGQIPSTLKFAKVLGTNYGPYRPGRAYEAGTYLFVEDDFNKSYKVTTEITADENKDFSLIAGKLEQFPPEVEPTEDGSEPSSQANEDISDVVTYETGDVALDRVDKSDNSFGSFMFVGDLTPDEKKAIVAKNTGFGTRYLCSYAAPANGKTPTEIVTEKASIVGDSGATGFTFVQGDSKFSAAMPMSIFAATDYDSGDEAPCHMFKTFPNETPTVFDDSAYETLSKDFVNFYGQTQSNGKKISFYQRGFNTDGTDTAIYCNEVWFKSRCITRIMNLFMSTERIPANNEGLAMVRFRIAEVCDIATSNGSFMPKTPSEFYQNSIRNIIVSNGGTSEDADEIVSGIENVGYGIFTNLSQKDGEYFIHYWVFYGTADSIRFVKGDDVMVK